MKAVYPGSFDPVTKGHFDIIQRASKLFEKLLILVSDNPEKTSKIPVEKRIQLIEETCTGMENIEVQAFTGLTVDFVEKHNYDVLLRSIRGASDFETELEMSQINKALSDYDTVFLMTRPKYSFIRSSRVWELLKFGGKVEELVPENVNRYLLSNNS